MPASLLHTSIQEIPYSQAAISRALSSTGARQLLPTFPHVHRVEIFYSPKIAKQDSNMQCLQSWYSERWKLTATTNTINETWSNIWKCTKSKHKDYLAKGQNNEKSHQ